jgi:hypothetical protein
VEPVSSRGTARRYVRAVPPDVSCCTTSVSLPLAPCRFGSGDLPQPAVPTGATDAGGRRVVLGGPARVPLPEQPAAIMMPTVTTTAMLSGRDPDPRRVRVAGCIGRSYGEGRSFRPHLGRRPLECSPPRLRDTELTATMLQCADARCLPLHSPPRSASRPRRARRPARTPAVAREPVPALAGPQRVARRARRPARPRRRPRRRCRPGRSRR